MKCLNPRYSGLLHAYVPCQDCYFCRLRKKYEWTCRVLMERLYFPFGYFITLTYNNDNLPENRGVNYEHAYNFLAKLRRFFRKYHLEFSYYLMSEYGGRSLRPHYHLHLFTPLPLEIVQRLVNEYWTFGFNKIGRTTAKSVLYTSSFHLLPKEHKLKYPVPNFHIISRGLGKHYADDAKDYNLSHNRKFFEFGGFKFNLPPYIKKRMGFEDSLDIRDLSLFEVKNGFYLKCVENGFRFKIYEQWENYVNHLNDLAIRKGLKYSI